MKILQAHNYYQQAGGEDTVVAQEKQILEKNGHEVITFYKQNEDINSWNKISKLRLIKEVSWSKKVFQEVDEIIKANPVNVCHVHNTLPLISPSIYYACKSNNVPVVQTLHNYRLICTNGLLMRNGRICEECLGRSPYGAIAKKCYRNSALQTFVVARMLQKNKRMGTWEKQVDAYICLTEMAKEKFIAHGIPENKLFVKPNFIEVSLKPEVQKDDYLLYAGRITAEKGAKLIQSLATKLDYPIKVVGEGALAADLKGISSIELLGRKSHAETLKLMQKAKAVLFPSLLYEGMPMTIIEAFALKTPIIASGIGAAKSMISDMETGILFDYNSAESLIEKVNFCLNHPQEMSAMAEKAFREYENHYTAKENLKMLIKLYQSL